MSSVPTLSASSSNHCKLTSSFMVLLKIISTTRGDFSVRKLVHMDLTKDTQTFKLVQFYWSCSSKPKNFFGRDLVVFKRKYSNRNFWCSILLWGIFPKIHHHLVKRELLKQLNKQARQHYLTLCDLICTSII